MTTVKQRRDRRGVAWALIGAFAAAALVILIYSIAYTGDQAQNAASNSDTSSELLSVVKDCVEPGGECYKRARQQRLGTVRDINQVTAYAVACSSQLDPQMRVAARAATINDCIDELLALSAEPSGS